MAPPVIQFDYAFAPNAQKVRNLLGACGIPYKNCEQPFVMPRPILADLGITYRRIPLMAIGKDVFIDNSRILDAVQGVFPAQALKTSPADHAYEAFGYRTFWAVLPLVDPSLLTKDMVKDRACLFTVFGREDYTSLRSSSLGEMRSLIDIVEKEFLVGPGPWIGGEKCSVADIHAMWIIKWAIQTVGLDKQKGFGREDFPKVYAWIEGLKKHDADNEPEKLTQEEMKKVLLGSEYAIPKLEFDEEDPLVVGGLTAGAKVAVDSNDDAQPGHTPQLGKFVGVGRRDVTVELENGLRVHFPRIGYVVRPA